MNNNLQSQNLNVDIRKNSTAVKCESCEGETFREVVFMRKISKLFTGSSSDSYIPVPSFQCSSCGHINEEFTPKFDQA
jgi:uncharacterized Zn finger protein